MEIQDTSFILIIAVPGVLILIALLNFIANGEAFGLNPMISNCTGKKISYETIKKYLPYGEIEFKTPVHVKYNVSEKNTVKTFCLGQMIK